MKFPKSGTTVPSHRANNDDIIQLEHGELGGKIEYDEGTSAGLNQSIDNNEIFKEFLNTSVNLHAGPSNTSDGKEDNDDITLNNSDMMELRTQNWLVSQGIKKKSFKEKVKHVVHSGRFHLALVILVIVESLLVSGEVIIYDLEAYLIKHHSDLYAHKNQHSLNNHSAHFDFNATNLTSFHNFDVSNHAINSKISHSDHLNGQNNLTNLILEHAKAEIMTSTISPLSLTSLHDHHSRSNIWFKVLHVVEEICRWGSISILAFFMIELTIKFIFDPTCFKRVMEMMDAIVIIVSFSLNVYLVVQNVEIHAITGLITLLRLWRIAEIVQAIAVAIESKYKAKHKKMEKHINFLETENKKLMAKIMSQK